MGKDLLHSAMKVIAKENGVKLSAQNDLYKMQAPYFVNVFFCEYPVKNKPGKINIHLVYELKYAYFDDLTLYIIECEPVTKLTDKVRANSIIKCDSKILQEYFDFDFDGKEESYPDLAERVFEHIKDRYREFFDDVEKNYGNLENYFTSNKEQYPRQAALVYIHNGDYINAEKCLKMMPPKMYCMQTIHPQTEEQRQRLISSNAQPWGDAYHRDDMDCHLDFIVAKLNGLEWTAERATYGLLDAERYLKG